MDINILNEKYKTMSSFQIQNNTHFHEVYAITICYERCKSATKCFNIVLLKDKLNKKWHNNSFDFHFSGSGNEIACEKELMFNQILQRNIIECSFYPL